MPEQTIPPGAKLLRLLTALLLPTGLAGAAIEPPALVEYRLPWTVDDEAWMISVRYAADGTSVAESHAAANTPMVAPANDDSKYLPGAWIAGPGIGEVSVPEQRVEAVRDRRLARPACFSGQG